MTHSYHTKCELCDDRATMCIYAMNPGTAVSEAKRGDNPFYPIEQADFAMNLCTDCFHDMAQTMREEQYIKIRGTGVRPNKPPARV